MNITHKVFLYWLLYVAVVISGITASTLFGLTDLVLSHDHSYLSYVLIGLYLLAEILTGNQVIWINARHKEISNILGWLKGNKISSMHINKDKSVDIYTYGETSPGLTIKKGLFADLIESFTDKSKNSFVKQIDQGTLINAYMDRLYRKTTICEFLSDRIIMLGILATIIGVTIAFWPFLQPNMTIETMRANVGQFFPGVAVAFIPTAVSFVFKLALDINSKISNDGVDEVMDMSTVACSSYILPFLESNEVVKD